MNHDPVNREPKLRSRYRCRGTIALDIAVGTMVCAALSLMAVDLVFLLIGYSSNDVACRDAARAAGTADSEELALTAATLACSTHRTDGILVSQPQLNRQNFGFGVTPPDSGSPCVSVITRVNINLPMLRLTAKPDANDSAVVRRKYVYPALSLIQQAPQITPIDIGTIVTAQNTGLPDTSGLIAGAGSSLPSPDCSE